MLRHQSGKLSELIHIYVPPLPCSYGFHISKTSYLICQHLPTIKRIFDRLRNFGGEREYPRSCGGYSIVHTRDVTTGYDSSQPGQKCVSLFQLSSKVRHPCLEAALVYFEL